MTFWSFWSRDASSTLVKVEHHSTEFYTERFVDVLTQVFTAIRIVWHNLSNWFLTQYPSKECQVLHHMDDICCNATGPTNPAPKLQDNTCVWHGTACNIHVSRETLKPSFVHLLRKRVCRVYPCFVGKSSRDTFASED